MPLDLFTTVTSLTDEELDKLAILRIVECANGITQFMQGVKDTNVICVEDTRKFISFFMPSIRRQKIIIERYKKKLKTQVKEIGLFSTPP